MELHAPANRLLFKQLKGKREFSRVDDPFAGDVRLKPAFNTEDVRKKMVWMRYRSALFALRGLYSQVSKHNTNPMMWPSTCACTQHLALYASLLVSFAIRTYRIY